jgi:hypothetical protein
MCRPARHGARQRRDGDETSDGGRAVCHFVLVLVLLAAAADAGTAEVTAGKANQSALLF